MTDLDPLYDAVGRVVVEGARLEMQVSDLVAALMHAPLAVFAVRGQSPEMLQRLADALLDNEHLDEPLRSQCRAALSEVKRVQDRRNFVVHGAWVPVADASTWHAFRPRRFKIDSVVERFSVADLRALAHEMATLSTRCFMLAWNVQAPLSGQQPMDIDENIQVVSGHIDPIGPGQAQAD